MLAKEPQARPRAEQVPELLAGISTTAIEKRVITSSRRHTRTAVRWPGLKLYGSVAIIALICGSALLVYFGFRPSRDGRGSEQWPMPQVVPFTTLPDQQATPSFSPDGKTVAFAWGSVITHRFSICTMPAAGGKETCLTPQTESDYSPAWSPDGKWIAYLSGAFGEKGALYIRSPGGNSARKLSDVPPGNWPTQRALAWTRDSKAVIAKEDFPLFLVPLAGQPRPLTSPPQLTSDYDPSVSSDGREFVFTRSTRLAATLYRARLDAPQSLQRIVLPPTRSPQYLDAFWFPNRPELLVNIGRLGEIWRVPLNGAPQLLAQDSFGITDVTVSPDGRHAIYVQDRPDVNLWTLKLTTTHPTPELADSLSSTRSEFDPQYSADGRMVAFQSDRSGNPEIWVGARDGSDVKQLTHFEGPETGAPYWSPDGKSITFHSRVEGLATIFVVPTAGGTPRAISPKDFASELPSWSHDGKWIYFTSSRSGRMEIWRVRPDGGNLEQITRHGGYAAIDSMDSRFVYYAKSRNQNDGLWRLSLETGEDVRVLPRVLERAFGITRDAIYYGYLVDGFTRTAIEKLPYGATKPIHLAIFPKPIVSGLAVRPDESELMLGQLDSHTSQLMMMNFVH